MIKLATISCVTINQSICQYRSLLFHYWTHMNALMSTHNTCNPSPKPVDCPSRESQRVLKTARQFWSLKGISWLLIQGRFNRRKGPSLRWRWKILGRWRHRQGTKRPRLWNRAATSAWTWGCQASPIFQISCQSLEVLQPLWNTEH